MRKRVAIPLAIGLAGPVGLGLSMATAEAAEPTSLHLTVNGQSVVAGGTVRIQLSPVQRPANRQVSVTTQVTSGARNVGANAGTTMLTLDGAAVASPVRLSDCAGYLAASWTPRNPETYDPTSAGATIQFVGGAEGCAAEEPEPTDEDPKPTGTDPKPTGTDPKPTDEDPKPTGTDPKPTGTDPKPTGGEPISSTGPSCDRTCVERCYRVCTGNCRKVCTENCREGACGKVCREGACKGLHPVPPVVTATATGIPGPTMTVVETVGGESRTVTYVTQPVAVTKVASSGARSPQFTG